MWISSTTMPRFWLRVPQIPPTADSGHWISTAKMGSMRHGSAVIMQAYITRRAVGMIWPTTVNGVGVEGDVVDRPPHAAAVLLGEWAFLGCPLEATNDTVLDFVEVLDTLGAVGDEVRASAFRTEAPDFARLTNVPVVFVGQVAAADLWVVLGGHLAIVNVGGELFAERLGLHVQTVVLVG